MELRRAAELGLKTLDLTSLADDDTDEKITALCRRAVTSFGPTAAICIYPRFIPIAKQRLRELNTDLNIATVCVFPHGRANLEMARAETAACLAYGADEVDTVLPYQELLNGNSDVCRRQLDAVREACEGKTLKVILETGELKDADLVRQASRLAIDAGANFIKTSTGKVPVNATLEAAEAMLEVIADAPRLCGLKIAGGVRSVADAAAYLQLAASRMSDDYLAAETFRFGASGLLDALLAELRGEAPQDSSSTY